MLPAQGNNCCQYQQALWLVPNLIIVYKQFIFETKDFKVFLLITYIKHLESVCNAHEKEVDSLEERNQELEEALLGMVNQFCQMGEEGYLSHTFMSAEETAFDVLDIDYGEKADDVWERFTKKWGR